MYVCIYLFSDVPANPMSRRRLDRHSFLSIAPFHESKTCFFQILGTCFSLQPPMNCATSILRGRRRVARPSPKNIMFIFPGTHRWFPRSFLRFVLFVSVLLLLCFCVCDCATSVLCGKHKVFLPSENSNFILVGRHRTFLSFAFDGLNVWLLCWSFVLYSCYFGGAASGWGGKEGLGGVLITFCSPAVGFYALMVFRKL